MRDGSMAGIERCKAVMRNLEESPEVAKRVFEDLTEAEMATLGLRTFQLNYYAIYGRTHSRREIDLVAKRALQLKLWLGWEHHAHLQRMGSIRPPSRMANLPISLIEELRSRHGGLVLASFQFGAIREIFTEIALADVPITFALARSVHDEYLRSRENNPAAAVWRTAQVADAESLEGISKLNRALERGEVVLVCVDGNTGMGGAHDLSGRSEIEFLGQRVFVKTGAARIAARHGTPILPLLAPLTKTGAACHRVGRPIDPVRRLRGVDAKEFAAMATETVYGRLERHVRRLPEQWGVVESFHRWRSPDRNAPVIGTNEIHDRMRNGMSIAVAPCSYVTSADRDGHFLVTNVKSLRSIRVPSGMRPILDRLGDDNGLNASAMRSEDGSKALPLVEALGSLGCLAFAEGTRSASRHR